MGRIQLLDDEVINKIAAGEVVERPASVVKELVENAIDAGATQIGVHLELGGSRSIAVSDNGSGMDQDDALRALTRHATSKIRAADDLFQIHTMGFRGEALASIAAVSRFSLATNATDDHEGVKVSVAGGTDLAQLPWNGARGTTVAVENLFYNMPVRAKFLKAPATEFSHCLELVQAFALCHPEIGFSVHHNAREHFRVAPVKTGDRPWIGEPALRERAVAVIGKDAAQLLYVKSTSRFGDFEALLSPPGFERPTSRHMFTFVNGRWVKDKTLRYGILRGYHSHILKGKFPIAVMHLTVDPTLIDVNVHPAKTELRFQYPSEVQNLLALAIRDKLRDGEWAEGPLPDFSRNPVRQGAPAAMYDAVAAGSTTGHKVTERTFHGATSASRSYGGASWSPRPVSDREGLDLLLKAEVQAPTPVETQTIPWDELDYQGCFDKCFLFFGVRDQLLVIDQHAFHERILYERLVRDESLLSQSQALLVPESLELSPSEVATLRSRRAALLKRGFDFKADSETSVTITSVPSMLAGRDLVELFSDLAREPSEDHVTSEPADTNAEMARLILANTACHAAVRAGEELPEGELRQLLAEAKTVDFFHNCPHGRRVFRWWTRDQVARWFDR